MNVPTTLIIESTDRKKLPGNVLAVLLKNFFMYGRTGLTTNGDQCYLHLSYCPKRETMERKLKELPVKFMRVFAESEEEFRLLLKGLQAFRNINFSIEEEEIPLTIQQPPPSLQQPQKPQLQHNQQPQQYQQPQQKGKRKLASKVMAPPPPPNQTAEASSSKIDFDVDILEEELQNITPNKRRKITSVADPTTSATFITPDLTIELDGDESQFFQEL